MKHIGNIQVSGSLQQSGSGDNIFLGNVSISGSTIYKGGSTKFGDDVSDLHVFTGSMEITSDLLSTKFKVDDNNYIASGGFDDGQGFTIPSGIEIKSNGAITFNINGTDAAAIYETGGTIYFDVSPSSFYDGASSIRFKDNIENLSQSYLDNFDQLVPRQWNWKSDGSFDFGLVAEELENIYPELISRADDGTVRGIFYSKIIPIMLQSLLDARERITALEQQLNGGV
jgi:hypothetical protein